MSICSIAYGGASEMRISMNVYGEQARRLLAELGGNQATRQMKASFRVRYVEGRPVVQACFEG
jgi:hypothetical protein